MLSPTCSRELANINDVVVLDQYGTSWALDTLRCTRNSPLLVHVAHDFESQVTADIARNYSGGRIGKFLLHRNAMKTYLAEQALARECRIVVTLTEQDGAAFARLNPRLHTIVVPPGYSGPKQLERRLDGSVPRRVIIVGSFGWIAKQMNLQRFLEAASASFAQNGIEVHVFGSVPGGVRSRLRARFPEVVFRGFVDDLGEEFRKARLALVPEETGGGFKLKILDYIFGRVPVAAISSALNGIPPQLKSQFIVADDLPSLADRIVGTIGDFEQLNAMQHRAFALAEGVFDWDTNGRRFVRALEGVAGRSIAFPRDGSSYQHALP